jgi:hypothetical protein
MFLGSNSWRSMKLSFSVIERTKLDRSLRLMLRSRRERDFRKLCTKAGVSESEEMATRLWDIVRFASWRKSLAKMETQVLMR